jgi:hypothetical protein
VANSRWKASTELLDSKRQRVSINILESGSSRSLEKNGWTLACALSQGAKVNGETKWSMFCSRYAVLQTQKNDREVHEGVYLAGECNESSVLIQALGYPDEGNWYSRVRR